MLRVLRHLAEHFSAVGVYRLNTPFDVPGLDFEAQVAPVLRRLSSASPPYIEGISVDRADYPVVLTGLTERGWEAAEAAGDSAVEDVASRTLCGRPSRFQNCGARRAW
jgi:hypothetical protein